MTLIEFRGQSLSSEAFLGKQPDNDSRGHMETSVAEEAPLRRVEKFLVFLFRLIGKSPTLGE